METVALDPLIGRTVADGRYRIVRPLGAGGMATVYQARQIAVDRLVALKLIRASADGGGEELAERFQQEMRATAKIEHPNTIRVYDFGQLEDGRLFLAMEYLEGQTLRQLLKKEPRPALPRTLAIAVQIAKALGAAHQEGIVHRDLKPENIILLDRYGEADFVKVLDFGIARSIDEGAQHRTAAGVVIGTPAYMAPEQAAGQAVDGRTDLYALGIILYEMISGATPFDKPTTLSLLMAHAQELPPPIESRALYLPPGVAAIVTALLAKDPARRPPSAVELAESLRRELQDLKSGLPLPSAPAPESFRLSELEPAFCDGGQPAHQSEPGLSYAPKPTPQPDVQSPPVETEVGHTRHILAATPATTPTTALPGVPPQSDASPAGLIETRIFIPLGQVPPHAPDPDDAHPIEAPAPAQHPAAHTRTRDRRSRSLGIVAVALIALAGLTGAILHSHFQRARRRAEAELLERQAMRADFEKRLLAQGEPAAPPSCHNDDRALVAALQQAASLLYPTSGTSPDPQAARKLLSTLGTQSAERWTMLGRAAFLQGDDRTALDAAQRATALCADYAAPFNLAGKAAQRLGVMDDAETAFSRALQLADLYAAARFNLALLRIRQGQGEAAAALLTHIIDRNPDHPNAYLVRGQAHLLAHDERAAVSDLRQATARNGNDPSAWMLLAQALARQGMVPESKTALCRAQSLGGKIPGGSCSP